MPGVSNFVQWNPGQANQETDSAYLTDPQRSGGAVVGAAFPSQTANKLFYQISTGVAALMQMMATKGYNVADTNLGTLASVLSAIQTAADVKGLLLALPWASTVTCDASLSNGFQVVLQANTTIRIINQTPGQLLTFQFQQGTAGNFTITWPSNFYGAPALDPLGGSYTLVSFLVGTDSAGRVFTPGMSVTQGLVGTLIGQQAPQAGTFTNLVATISAALAAITGSSLNVTGAINGNSVTTSLVTTNGEYVNGNLQVTGSSSFNVATMGYTPPISDSTANIPTTQWVHNLLNTLGVTFNAGGNLTFGTASKGHISFPAFFGGLIIQWGNVLMPGSGGSDNPTPFTYDVSFNHILSIVATTFSSATVDRIVYVYNVGNAGATMSNNGSGTNATYIAIGY